MSDQFSGLLQGFDAQPLTPVSYTPGWPTPSLTPWGGGILQDIANGAATVDAAAAPANNGGTNPFGIAGNMVDGQSIGAGLGLSAAKAAGVSGTDAAMAGYNKAISPIGNALLIGQQAYQADQDIKNGASPGDAALGGAVNGAAIYLAGKAAGMLPFGFVAGPAAGWITEKLLPDPATTGSAVRNWGQQEGLGLYNSQLYGGP